MSPLDCAPIVREYEAACCTLIGAVYDFKRRPHHPPYTHALHRAMKRYRLAMEARHIAFGTDPEEVV